MYMRMSEHREVEEAEDIRECLKFVLAQRVQAAEEAKRKTVVCVRGCNGTQEMWFKFVLAHTGSGGGGPAPSKLHIHIHINIPIHTYTYPHTHTHTHTEAGGVYCH